MNAQIRIVGISETIGCRDGLAGILHQVRVLRMQKCALALAKKSEARFVDGSRADRPGVADVHLLNSFVGQVAKAGNVRATRLETRKRLREIMIRQVVVAGEVLIPRQLVIHFQGELIAMFVAERHTLKQAGAAVCVRDELIQQVERGLVHARGGNLVGGEHGGILGAVRDGDY